MKCPYCGAEVTPNTKCEYCDSFVEREENETNSKKEYAEILGEFIFESAEHLAEGLHNASQNINNAYKENNNAEKAEQYEETIKRVSSPENKRTLKKLIITFSLIIIFPIILYIIFVFLSLWFNLFHLFSL